MDDIFHAWRLQTPFLVMEYAVQVWKGVNGTLVFKYTGHTAEVEGVTWSPDSKRVVSASDDQTVQLWQVL